MESQIDSSTLPKLLFSVQETAAMLSISEKSVYRLIQRGLLKCSSALRHKMITRDSILDFVKSTAIYVSNMPLVN